MRGMSLEDRAWYREDVERRRRAALIPPVRSQWLFALTAAIVVVAVVQCGLLVSIAFASRCDGHRWVSMPVACFRLGWATLVDVVTGDMVEMQGDPAKIQTEGEMERQRTLPKVITPTQR